MAIEKKTAFKGGRAPSFFVSHGAGPFAILGAPHQQPLVELCKETQWVLDGAKGVILVTAHWQTDQPHISSGANPEIYYDYFDEESKQLPKEAWEIKYPCKGDPILAQRIKERLDKEGFESVLDDKRGWDHGVWVPMLLLRPQADIPVVQVSIPTPEKETEHSLKLGVALESFRNEGYVILGSGSSYHNFDAIIPSIMGVPGAPPVPNNRPFEDAMEKVATIESRDEKLSVMSKWRETFPDNEVVQPVGKSEHFMPFLVNIGAAGSDVGTKLGEWNLFGTIMTSYIW
jgi:aromatic ring-opening dioxygenase catalytic subunit (LigB family)